MKTLKLTIAILFLVSMLSCKKNKNEDPVPVVQKSQGQIDMEKLATQGKMYEIVNGVINTNNFVTVYLAPNGSGKYGFDFANQSSWEYKLDNGIFYRSYGTSYIYAGTYKLDSQYFTVDQSDPNLGGKVTVYKLNK